MPASCPGYPECSREATDAEAGSFPFEPESIKGRKRVVRAALFSFCGVRLMPRTFKTRMPPTVELPGSNWGYRVRVTQNLLPAPSLEALHALQRPVYFSSGEWRLEFEGLDSSQARACRGREEGG